MPVVLSDLHRRCILLVALAYLCVSVHGLSYAVSAESLFIDKVAYYESGVSEAAEPGPMPTILNWTASRSRHLAPGGILVLVLVRQSAVVTAHLVAMISLLRLPRV